MTKTCINKKKARGKNKPNGETKEILAIHGEWEEIKGIVDSGAVDSVAHPDTGKAFPIVPMEASKAEKTYTVADGRQIPNRGKKDFEGYTRDGLPINMGNNITDVVKTLFSTMF